MQKHLLGAISWHKKAVEESRSTTPPLWFLVVTPRDGSGDKVIVAECRSSDPELRVAAGKELRRAAEADIGTVTHMIHSYEGFTTLSEQLMAEWVAGEDLETKSEVFRFDSLNVYLWRAGDKGPYAGAILEVDDENRGIVAVLPLPTAASGWHGAPGYDTLWE